MSVFENTHFSNLVFPLAKQHLTKKLVFRPACGTVLRKLVPSTAALSIQTSVVVTLDVLWVLVYSFTTLPIQESLAQYVCKPSIPHP